MALNESMLDGNSKNPKAVISKQSKESVEEISRPLEDLPNKKKQNVKKEVFNSGWVGICDGRCRERDEAHRLQLLVDYYILPTKDDLDDEFEQPNVFIRRADTQEGRSAVSKGRERKKSDETASMPYSFASVSTGL